jgi:hypothetical protein
MVLQTELLLKHPEYQLSHMSPEILLELKSKIYCEARTNKAEHIIGSYIDAIIPDIPPILPRSTDPPPQQIQRLPREHSAPLDIFTDAGLTYSLLIANLIFRPRENHESFTGGAAVARNSVFRSIHTVDIPVQYVICPDPYELEALALVSVLLHLGDEASYAHLYVDNEALVKKMNQTADSQDLPQHPLVNTLCQMRIQKRLNVHWIQSHPELRKPRDKWSA